MTMMKGIQHNQYVSVSAAVCPLFICLSLIFLKQKKAAKREEALASFEAWKAMKEKEAKKIAAQKRLEAKNKKKTEEENAVRKEEALQVLGGLKFLVAWFCLLWLLEISD